MERRRIVFIGRVQGVGFRATAAAVASRHLVSGWVRNEPDGSVVLEIQGDPAEIDGCLKDLTARMGWFIRGQESCQIPPEQGPSGFDVRR